MELFCFVYQLLGTFQVLRAGLKTISQTFIGESQSSSLEVEGKETQNKNRGRGDCLVQLRKPKYFYQSIVGVYIVVIGCSWLYTVYTHRLLYPKPLVRWLEKSDMMKNTSVFLICFFDFSLYLSKFWEFSFLVQQSFGLPRCCKVARENIPHTPWPCFLDTVGGYVSSFLLHLSIILVYHCCSFCLSATNTQKLSLSNQNW